MATIEEAKSPDSEATQIIKAVERSWLSLGLIMKRVTETQAYEPLGFRSMGAVLERIIEKVDNVEVTDAAVAAAVQTCAKINATGQWIDRTETVSLYEVFDWMTAAELEAYAHGKLPDWFPQTATARAPAQGQISLGARWTVSHI